MIKSNSNKLIATVFLFISSLLVLNACSENPAETVVSNERAITDFRVDNQIGVPIIERPIDDGSNVTIFVQSGMDLTAVAPEITVSYKATVTPGSGEEVNFAENDGQYNYVVTSESGQSRDWLVTIEEFESNLSGTWEVTGIMFDYYFGEGEDWGWGEVRPLYWNLPQTEDLIGNLFHFEIEGTDEDGRNFGTFIQEGDAVDFGDWAYKFDRLPTDQGTYHRDFSNDILIFNEGTENENRTMTLEFSEDEQSLNIVFNNEQDIDWDNLNDLNASRMFWYELEKVD